MTALPQPTHLLTVAEYAQLGEDDRYRWELQEGNLVTSPSPTPRHMRAVLALGVHLKSQLPANLCVIPDVDIDLELVPASQPGSARRPDLIVVDQVASDRVDREGGLLGASEVAVVVEIVSPGSRRMDDMTKRGEYADAGIPHYWIVDLDAPVSLLECQLAEGRSYQDGGRITGLFTTTEPFPFRLRLDKLL